MKKKEELFQLIKSLSKSEKRHFKILTYSYGNENNYLKLFDEIDRQEVYDEDFIKRKFNEEIFINQLTTTKNYLKNLIYKSLRLYYSDISKDATTKDCLRNAEILYQKGLYQLSIFEADKACRIAEDFEILSLQYEALGWKKKILQAIDPQQSPDLKGIALRQLKVAPYLKNYAECWLTSIDPKLSKDLLSAFSIDENEPLQLKMMKRLINFQYNISQGKPNSIPNELELILEEYDKWPEKKMADAETYLVLLNNLVAFYVFTKNLDEALTLINRAKNFIKSLSDYGAPIVKTLLRTYNIELEIYREQKDLGKGVILINEINNLIEEKKLLVPPSYLISFWFQFAYMTFLSKQYSESLRWLNILLEKRSGALRLDLISYAHWLNLMVHFELKNLFVLRYFVDSTKRFLKKRKKIVDYEQLLLKMFAKLAGSPESEIKVVFREFQVKLLTDRLTIPENVIDYIDFYDWIKGNAK